MEYKQILTDYLTKTLGKTDDEIATILTKLDADGKPTDEPAENALDTILTLNAEHIGKAGADISAAEKDRIHKETKFQTLSKAEADTRKDYGVEGKNLSEIIANAVKKAAEKAGADDSVLIHPLYTKLRTEKDEEIATIKAQADAEVLQAKNSAEKQSRYTAALPEIDAALIAAKVNLEEVKPATKKAFMAQFAGYDFEKSPNGTFIKDAEGKLLKDQQGHPLKLDSLVAQQAPDWFTIPVQPARQSPGNDNPGIPGPTKFTKDNLPATKEEFTALYLKTPDAERGDLMKVWQEAHPEG